jgi:uncharacterized small protein (TIGR04563 family)
MSTSDKVAAGGDKVEQSLYWPRPILEHLQTEAARLDRSISWVVQRSWTLSRERIEGFKSRDDASAVELHAASPKVKQTLYFPRAMLVQIQDEAARLDCSMSWLAQVAVDLACQEIAKLEP